MAGDSEARRLHLWSGLIVLSVFLAGAVAGAGVFAWLRPATRPWRPPHKELPALFAELELTAEQREKAKEIFDRHRATVEAIMKQNFPRVRAADEQTQRELRAILSETQNKKLDEIEARRPPPGRRGRYGPMGGPPTAGGPGSRGAGGDKAAPSPESRDAGLTGDLPLPPARPTH